MRPRRNNPIKPEMNEECLVWLEGYKYEGYKYEGYHKYSELYVDFSNERDIELFKSETGIEIGDKSFLLIKNITSEHILRRDSYYSLNLEILKEKKNYLYRPINNDDEEMSAIFAGVIEFKNQSTSELLNFLSKPHRHETSSLSKTTSIDKISDLLPNEIDKVKVLNVLQGNWNELKYNEQVKIVYDIGGCLYSSMNNNVQRWKQCGDKYSLYKPILVISHWDVDHYITLVDISEDELKNSFSGVICPNHKAGHMATQTWEKLKRVFNHNAIKIDIPSRKSKYVLNELFSEGDKIWLYIGEKNSNRNLSGIQVFVEGEYKDCLLTGDCNYRQVENILNLNRQSANSTKPIAFVVPHHGTEVYPSNVQLTLNKNSNSVAIISVGKNNYGHPSNNTIKYLSPYFGNIKKTDNDGDVEDRL